MNPNEYIGKTLAEVAAETVLDLINGYSVFLLYNEDDLTGREVETSYSVKAILKNHPELSECVVKRANDFYGTWVFRVLKEGELKCHTLQ